MDGYDLSSAAAKQILALIIGAAVAGAAMTASVFWSLTSVWSVAIAAIHGITST